MKNKKSAKQQGPIFNTKQQTQTQHKRIMLLLQYWVTQKKILNQPQEWMGTYIGNRLWL